LHKHGFFLSQQVGINEMGSFVSTILYHKDFPDWEVSSNVPLVLAKNDMQGMGSAITYARRYGIMSLLNIPAEDDDGNEASRSSGPPKGQAQSSGGW